MKNILLRLIFICLPFFVSAKQTPTNIDSLIKTLPHTTNDSLKFETYYQIVKELNFLHRKEAGLYKDSLLILSKKVNTHFAIGKTYNAIAYYFYNINQIDSTQLYYNSAYKKFEEGNHFKEKIQVLYNLGVIYSGQDNYNMAQLYMDSVYIHVINQKDSTFLFDYYETCGIISDKKGDYEKSMKQYIDALNIATLMDDKARIANANQRIGFIHYVIGNYPLALKYLKNSIKVEPNKKDIYSLSERFQYIGLIYESSTEYDSALFYYNKAIELNLELDDKSSLASNYHNIGVIYSFLNNFKQAENYFLRALKIKDESGTFRERASSYLNLGDTYTSLGQLKNAKAYLEKGATKARELNSLYLKQIANHYFANFYEKTGKHKKALAYFKKHKQQMDSLLNEEKLNIIEHYEIRYDTKIKEDSINMQTIQISLKEKEAAIKERKLKNRRNIIYAIGILTLLSILFLISLQRKNQLITSTNHQLEIEKQRAETFLKEVQHRVKNNLQFAASILDLHSRDIENKDMQAAVSDGRDRIEAMGLLHQKLLYQEQEPTSIDIKSYLVELVKNLSLAHDPLSKITISLLVDPIKLDVDKAMKIGLIVNELVTNAYKHIDKSLSNPKLNIRLEAKDKLYLTIQDNGKGFPINFNEEKSFGIQLVDLLVKQLNGQLNIENKQGAYYELHFS